jgi:hypothetical protein
MPFDWMSTPSPAPRRSAAEAFEDEIRERAGLFKRLGHPKSTAVHRCLGNIAWTFSASGKPPVSAAQVRKLVSEIYER